MGTRGAYGFRINGTDHIAYNNMDSYPGSLGTDVLTQCRKWAARPGKLEAVREAAASLKPIQEGSKPTPEQIKKCKKYAKAATSGDPDDAWYFLLRGAQGNLAAMLKLGFYINSAAFLKDSLFCEWAYIVNLDDGVLEVYRGFQHKRHNRGRYGRLREDSKAEYWGVALIKTYPLARLPSKTAFVEELAKLIR